MFGNSGRFIDSRTASTTPAQVVTVTSTDTHQPVDNTDPTNPVIVHIDPIQTTLAALTAVLQTVQPGLFLITDTTACDNGIQVSVDVSGTNGMLGQPSRQKVSIRADASYLNADWQAVGVYTGVPGFGTQRKLWVAANEAGTPYVNGDVVIWINTVTNQWTHYKVIDATQFNGTNPQTNINAYAALSRSATTGYIQTWDKVDYDFANDFIIRRSDVLGNTVDFLRGLPGTGSFQWGNSNWIGNTIGHSNSYTITDPTTSLQNNRIGTLNTFVFSGSGCTITDSVFQNNGTYTLSGTNDFIDDSQLASSVALTISGAAKNMSNSRIDAGCTINCNGFSIGNGSRIGQGLTITLLKDMSADEVNQNGSSVSLDTNAQASAGLILTIPAHFGYAGTINLTVSGGNNIAKITAAAGDSIPTWNWILKCANGITNTVVPTLVGAAVADNCVGDDPAATNLVVVGRTNGWDQLQFLRSGNLNKIVNPSIIQ